MACRGDPNAQQRPRDVPERPQVAPGSIFRPFFGSNFDGFLMDFRSLWLRFFDDFLKILDQLSLCFRSAFALFALCFPSGLGLVLSLCFRTACVLLPLCLRSASPRALGWCFRFAFALLAFCFRSVCALLSLCLRFAFALLSLRFR